MTYRLVGYNRDTMAAVCVICTGLDAHDLARFERLAKPAQQIQFMSRRGVLLDHEALMRHRRGCGRHASLKGLRLEPAQLRREWRQMKGRSQDIVRFVAQCRLVATWQIADIFYDSPASVTRDRRAREELSRLERGGWIVGYHVPGYGNMWTRGRAMHVKWSEWFAGQIMNREHYALEGEEILSYNISHDGQMPGLLARLRLQLLAWSDGADLDDGVAAGSVAERRAKRAAELERMIAEGLIDEDGWSRVSGPDMVPSDHTQVAVAAKGKGQEGGQAAPSHGGDDKAGGSAVQDTGAGASKGLASSSTSTTAPTDSAAGQTVRIGSDDPRAHTGVQGDDRGQQHSHTGSAGDGSETDMAAGDIGGTGAPHHSTKGLTMPGPAGDPGQAEASRSHLTDPAHDAADALIEAAQADELLDAEPATRRKRMLKDTPDTLHTKAVRPDNSRGDDHADNSEGQKHVPARVTKQAPKGADADTAQEKAGAKGGAKEAGKTSESANTGAPMPTPHTPLTGDLAELAKIISQQHAQLSGQVQEPKATDAEPSSDVGAEQSTNTPSDPGKAGAKSDVKEAVISPKAAPKMPAEATSNNDDVAVQGSLPKADTDSITTPATAAAGGATSKTKRSVRQLWSWPAQTDPSGDNRAILRWRKAYRWGLSTTNFHALRGLAMSYQDPQKMHMRMLIPDAIICLKLWSLRPRELGKISSKPAEVKALAKHIKDKNGQVKQHLKSMPPGPLALPESGALVPLIFEYDNASKKPGSVASQLIAYEYLARQGAFAQRWPDFPEGYQPPVFMVFSDADQMRLTLTRARSITRSRERSGTRLLRPADKRCGIWVTTAEAFANRLFDEPIFTSLWDEPDAPKSFFVDALLTSNKQYLRAPLPADHVLSMDRQAAALKAPGANLSHPV